MGGRKHVLCWLEAVPVGEVSARAGAGDTYKERGGKPRLERDATAVAEAMKAMEAGWAEVGVAKQHDQSV